jgi:predicted O-linked N-acetylglucosamine transferase (SPINDLY family)
VVLGSLNRESKNSPEVLTCWRQILERAPQTILLIKLSTTDDDDCHMARYYQYLGVGVTPGITPDRIRFAHYGSNQAYFELFGQMDILLDTFPYSGTTTTCNALYNSVPVVTMSHPHLHAHNVSASLLNHVGVPELITTTPEAYVDTVVALADDPDRLTQYRSGALHRQFQRAMNPATFMPRYEAALLTTVRDQFV